MNKAVILLSKYLKDKDLLTLWMNNLLVLYAFLLPISQTIKSTVFTFIVVLFFIRGDVKKNLKFALANSVVRAFLYLFLVYLIGLLWTSNLHEGMSWVKSVKYGLYLIIFYAIVDGRYIDKVISAFILGMFVSELTSYGMIFGIMPWKLEIGGIVFYTAYALGDPSPFLHHIHYGVALAFTVLLLGQKIFFSDQKIWLKILMSIFMVTATTNIFVTGGRTGYITFIFLILVLSIVYLKRYALLGISLLVVIFFIAYNSSPIFQQKIKQTQNSIQKVMSGSPNYNTSIGTRVGLYKYGLEIFEKNPILGVGTGDSMDEIHKLTPEKWTSIKAQPHEHNQFLSVAVKLGIVGILVLLNLFYQIFRYKQEEKDLRFIQIFVTLAVFAGVMTTVFNLRFFLPLWVLMLSITLINRKRRTIHKSTINDKKQIVYITLAGTFFSISSLLHQLI